MSGFGSAAWLWWGGALAMALAGLSLVLWALFADWLRTRKHRPRRCPKCWYDLSGTDLLRCSECGYKTRRERKLHKSRRRWRWVFAGVLLLLAGIYPAVQPKVQRDGWWSLVSNRMLIAGLPFARDIDDPWCLEMARRIQTGTGRQNRVIGRSQAAQLMPMTRDDWRHLFARCVEGDSRARPVSADWQRKYGKLLRYWIDLSYPQPSPDGVAEQDILYELKPSVGVRTRQKWPANVPIYIEALAEHWWPQTRGPGSKIRQRTNDGSGIESSVGGGRPTPMLLTSHEIGQAVFEFDATIFHSKGPPYPTSTVEIPAPPITLEVEIVEDIGECIVPIRSKEIDQALENGLTVEIEPTPRGDDYSIKLSTQAVTNPQFDNIGFGFYYDIMRWGEVLATGEFWFPGGRNMDIRGLWVGGYGLGRNPVTRETIDRKAIFDGASPSDKWEIRFRSDPILALRVLDCDTYWDGEITISLTLPAKAAAGNDDDVNGAVDE